jgi:hypothetical protein
VHLYALFPAIEAQLLINLWSTDDLNDRHPQRLNIQHKRWEGDHSQTAHLVFPCFCLESLTGSWTLNKVFKPCQEIIYEFVITDPQTAIAGLEQGCQSRLPVIVALAFLLIQAMSVSVFIVRGRQMLFIWPTLTSFLSTSQLSCNHTPFSIWNLLFFSHDHFHPPSQKRGIISHIENHPLVLFPFLLLPGPVSSSELIPPWSQSLTC